MLTLRTLMTAALAIAAAVAAPPKAGADFGSEAILAAREAVGRRAGDYTLTDQHGKSFKLTELKGRPVVVTFIYTGCGHVCPTAIKSLERAFKTTGGRPLAGFAALTVGIDPVNDTAEKMLSLAGAVDAGALSWTFATAGKDTIEKMTRTLGFRYRKTEDGFDHLSLATVLDTDLRVIGQVYGPEFDSDEVFSAIAAAASPEKKYSAAPLGIIDRIKLLCYTYDEQTGEYRVDYTFLLTVALGLAVQGLMIFLAAYLLRTGAGNKRVKSRI